MNYTALFVILAVLAACSPASSNQAPETAAAPPEVLRPEQVRINGLSALGASAADVVKRLGKPDTIETGTIECGGHFNTPHTDPSDAVLYRYGGTSFEVYKQQAMVRNVDFRDGKFSATVAGTAVDCTTTVQRVQQLFLRAGQHVSDWNRNGTVFQVISLRPHPQADDLWQFLFLNGKLVEMDYFIPC